MTVYSNVVPPTAAETKRLYNRMSMRISQGINEQEALVARVAACVIRDKLVTPKSTHFTVLDGDVRIFYGNEQPCVPTYSIHKHAFTQILQKIGVPTSYANQLQNRSEAWRPTLLRSILNEHFLNQSFSKKEAAPKLLHRIVGGELRGFLSRRFNRHIASAPLLRAFIECCTSVGAVPIDATASDIKVALKCLLPHVFEPVPNEFVCVGVEWSNSDFGAGRMQVALSVWMPTGDRFVVLDHIVSRVHIGSVIEESDIEISEETAQAEAQAQASAIKDMVVGQLTGESVERLLGAIEKAHEEKISWHSLKGQLARFLSKNDIGSLQAMLDDEVIDLPPVRSIDGEKSPSKWWATQALAWLANRTEDPEKKMDLQHAAGAFLEVK